MLGGQLFLPLRSNLPVTDCAVDWTIYENMPMCSSSSILFIVLELVPVVLEIRQYFALFRSFNLIFSHGADECRRKSNAEKNTFDKQWMAWQK